MPAGSAPPPLPPAEGQPDQAAKRWLLFYLYALVFVQGLAINLTPLILPTLEKVLGLTKAQQGLVSSLGFIGTMVALVVSGYVTRLIRPRLSGTLAVVIMGLGALVMAYAPSYAVVLLASFVLGMGTSWILSVHSSVVTEFFYEQRQRMYLLILAFLAVGAVFGPYLFGYFLKRAGTERWQLVYLSFAFVLWALIALILLVGGGRLRAIGLGHRPAPREAAADDGDSFDFSEGFTTTLFQHVLTRGALYLLGFIVILDNFASMNILQWTATYAKERFTVDDEQAGIMMSMMAAGVLCGRIVLAMFVTGRFSDRMLLGFCYGMSMLMVVLMLLMPSFHLLVAAYFLMSFFMSAQAATTYAIGSEKFKGRAGVAIPIADAIGNIGSLVGPPLLGLYADKLMGGSIGKALWIVPVFGFGLSAVAIGWELVERWSRHGAAPGPTAGGARA